MQNRASTVMIDATVGGTTPRIEDAASETGWRIPSHFRWTVGIATALIVVYLVSLCVRPVGSYSALVDGWAVSAFELTLGAVCVARAYEATWRDTRWVARAFPLVLGAACVSSGVGHVVETLESLGGATPAVPSLADSFSLSFYPLCFLSFALLIRRDNRGFLLASTLDGLIAGLTVAAVTASLVSTIVRVTDTRSIAAATHLVYPIGDVLLVALAVGGLLMLPRGHKSFFGLAGLAMAVAAVGDWTGVLQFGGRLAYVANGVAWPLTITLLALAAWLLPATVKNPGTEWIGGFGLPIFGALTSVCLFFLASAGHVSKPTIALATLTILAAGVRLAIAVREAHAQRTARFQSLIDKTWDLIVVAEADLQVAYASASSERVLGHPPSDLEHEPLTQTVHPEDSALVLSQLLHLPSDANEAATFEVRMRHANGTWRTIAWTATNLLNDPSVGGYVLNGFDVTEARRQAEDLVAARDAALVASKTKSEFVSMMSHEIRTPMNGVIGLTDLLLETDLDGEQLELASGVKVSAESLLVIINDILDFSKIEAGKLEIEEATFDIRRVVDDVGRILAGSAHGKGIELLVDIDPEVPGVLVGDETRVQQVLLNFGSNAVKFTAEGEVVIRLRVLRENAARVALRFDVTDTGIGIDEQEEERLFSPFSQADSSTTRKYGGPASA